MKPQISDEFVIGIGNDIHSKSGFIYESIRKGAKFPEPYEEHRIQEWIISEFGLKYPKKYRVKVTVTILGEVKNTVVKK